MNNSIDNTYKMALRMNGLEGTIDGKQATFIIKEIEDGFKTLISATPFHYGSLVVFNNNIYIVTTYKAQFNQLVYNKGVIKMAQPIRIAIDNNDTNSFGTYAVVKMENQVTLNNELVNVVNDKYSFKTSNATSIGHYITYKKKLYEVSAIDDTIDGIYTIYAKFSGKAKEYSITLSEISKSLTSNSIYQITPTCTIDGTVDSSPVITYRSLDDSIATVSSSGLITSIKEGNTSIIATYHGIEVSINIVVLANVYTIDITNPITSINTGTTHQLTVNCTLNGSVVSNPIVTYSSSNTNVVTVSSSGLITGIADGDVTIQATYEGVSKTMSLNVSTPSTPTYTLTSSNGTFKIRTWCDSTFTAHRFIGSVEDTSASFTFSFTPPNTSITVTSTTGNSIKILNNKGYVAGTTPLIVKYNGEVVLTQAITFSS